MKGFAAGSGDSDGAKQLPVDTKDDNQNDQAAPAAAAKAPSVDTPRVTRASSQLQISARAGKDGPLVDIAPPEPEEEAQLDAATDELLDLETSHRPAKTVHLPPEAVQEERYRQLSAEKHRPSSSETEKHKHASRARSDAASSPSSTADAHSTTTPMHLQDSPNTSPDSETANVDVPLEFRPTVAEQRAKEQHDRQLAAQKAIAHDAALGDVNTPDDQLKWEEREAAAREAEERRATSDRNGPEPDAKLVVKETDAEALANEKEIEALTTPKHTAAARDEAVVGSPSEGGPTGTRARIAIDTHLTSQHSAHTLQSAQTATPESAKLVSADSAAVPLKTTVSGPASSPVIPQGPPVGPAMPSTVSATTWPSSSRPSSAQSVDPLLPDLASLRGAAEDPDRDYLESLFRIQAHDSPHISTHPLPELIKSASKTVSTDDQFAAMHERMEYRILRRIYHLQNANKWSLRQMDKCKEPEPPVTQHDHMMAEMKWMCKDFRAERKRMKNISAWLAERCAEWVAASPAERKRLQVQVKVPQSNVNNTEDADEDEIPELDESGDSPPQIEVVPGTPQDNDPFPSRVIVDAELLDSVLTLQHNGVLQRALKQLPVWQTSTDRAIDTVTAHPMTEVSKFVTGKILPKLEQPSKKRSRYDFDDEADDGDDDEEYRVSKKSRLESDLPPEDPNVAIFHADNKAIRDRLHAQNAFRPPSEFTMPVVAFYEFRYGSCWLPEDDHKLRRLAKDFAFNWSAISDQLTLPSRYKSGFDRRTPWECFERWVELEQMPVEMRKTAYFKTWYQRLEQSQQAVDKRYQAQLALVQAQSAQSGIAPQQQPSRRRTLPMRVEKRKNQRYLWVVDAMRKNAKKRELNQYKQAEATRAAAQRKASQQAEPQQAARQSARLTPQQFSQKRYERDVAVAKMQQAQREKMMEQQKQAQLARASAQQSMSTGMQQQQQQRQGMGQGMVQNTAIQMAAAQAQINAAQLTPQQRQQLQQMAARGAQFPGVNGQNVPQAQMQATTAAQQQNMQRMLQAQARNGIPGQQQQMTAMQNGNVSSPGPGGLSQQQQYANSQALLAAYKAQQQQQQAQQGNMVQQGSQSSPAQQHAMAASPSMGPPPMPAGTPQQLSSGHIPAVIKMQNQLRATYPQMTEEQIRAYATERLKSQSVQRTNAMNAAAGLNSSNSSSNNNGPNGSARAFQQNQAVGLNGANMVNGNASYSPQDGSPQTSSMTGMSGSTQHSYAQMMRQRQMAQMAHMQQSQNSNHSAANGSPVVAHASPNMNPASPSLQFTNMAGHRPPSRSATPQMQRLGSSSGVPGVTVPGMQSPGAASLQASPRGVQANMAR